MLLLLKDYNLPCVEATPEFFRSRLIYLRDMYFVSLTHIPANVLFMYRVKFIVLNFY